MAKPLIALAILACVSCKPSQPAPGPVASAETVESIPAGSTVVVRYQAVKDWGELYFRPMHEGQLREIRWGQHWVRLIHADLRREEFVFRADHIIFIRIDKPTS